MKKIIVGERVPLKRNLLLSLVLALVLALSVSAAEPEVSLGVEELSPQEAVSLGLADFVDVGAEHWAYDSVKKAVALGLVTGRGDGVFDPAATMSRAEAATMLWRMAGSPELAAESAFADVVAGSWYETAVSWAAASGVMNGVDAAHFAPMQNITRQELITVLFRMAGGVSGMEVMFASVYDAQFADNGDVAPWAKSAMYWGVYKELIRGTAENTLSPVQAVTRAEAAAILVRYTEKVN